MPATLSETEDQPKNFHFNDFIARHHHQQQQQQQPFHHNPSGSSTTMLYNNYYHHHAETPLPPLPSFFHPSTITPSTKAFHSIRDVVLHHQQQQHPHPHTTTSPHHNQAKIRVRNFPKEVVDGVMEEKKSSSLALHYHERDRLIREHQHEQQTKRSRQDGEEQQERIHSQPSLMMEGCSNVVSSNGDDQKVDEAKNYHSNKVAGDNDDTSNLMYTNRNSSGQHNNRFLFSVKGEFFCYYTS